MARVGISSFVRTATASVLCFVSSLAWGDLGPEDVLILVNKNSPTSRYISKLYRQFYPTISTEQVLELPNPGELSPPATGLAPLADCGAVGATTASEIITREQYNKLIAGPVRDWLLDANHPERISQIKVIITTAGMPYRIEDTVYGDVVNPAASNPYTVQSYTGQINAASVESELACLWFVDYGDTPAGTANRIVNPYQGYKASPADLFERQTPGTKSFTWSLAYNPMAVANPLMEGRLIPDWPPAHGASQRSLNAGDMFFVCRLDGPHQAGRSVVFAVREMLQRAQWASSVAKGGVNPLQAVAVFDDAANKSLDYNRVFNLDGVADCWVYEAGTQQPPDAPTMKVSDDYVAAFLSMVESYSTKNSIYTGAMPLAQGLEVIIDRRVNSRTGQVQLDEYAMAGRDAYQGVVFLASHGANDYSGAPANYLLNGGEGGGVLYKVVNGAVFTSIESFNALTMMTGASTGQAKIVDFITIGGAGAIGHAFEPICDAVIDNEFLAYNLLADEDGDGKADLTFVEAAYSAIPYLSWAEVVIGDPLMRITYGSGGKAWTTLEGDANNNNTVEFGDIFVIRSFLGGTLETTDINNFNKYNDLCDVNQNGTVEFGDIFVARSNLGKIRP